MKSGMILHGTNFGNVWQASGATNFDGRGWWYHPFGKLFGLSFKGSTFVAKTTTFEKTEGRMKMKSDGITPREWRPKCIHINWKTGAAINAVGLSGPGLHALLEKGFWQSQTEPFFISLMSLKKTAAERLREIAECVDLLQKYKHEFRAAWGIQANFSCPNGGLKPEDLIEEVIPNLDVMRILNVPLMPKFGPDILPKAAVEIAKHPGCDAICVFNTIPWNKLPEAERLHYFGTTVSPLERHYPGFPGGVSGEPLHKRLLPWLHEVRSLGVRKPICAGGGILSITDAEATLGAGATSIFLGSVAFLRPWRVQSIIRRTNALFNS